MRLPGSRDRGVRRPGGALTAQRARRGRRPSCWGDSAPHRHRGPRWPGLRWLCRPGPTSLCRTEGRRGHGAGHGLSPQCTAQRSHPALPSRPQRLTVPPARPPSSACPFLPPTTPSVELPDVLVAESGLHASGTLPSWRRGLPRALVGFQPERPTASCHPSASRAAVWDHSVSQSLPDCGAPPPPHPVFSLIVGGPTPSSP